MAMQTDPEGRLLVRCPNCGEDPDKLVEEGERGEREHDWEKVPESAVSFDGGTFYSYECQRCGEGVSRESARFLPDGPCASDDRQGERDVRRLSGGSIPDTAHWEDYYDYAAFVEDGTLVIETDAAKEGSICCSDPDALRVIYALLRRELTDERAAPTDEAPEGHSKAEEYAKRYLWEATDGLDVDEIREATPGFYEAERVVGALTTAGRWGSPGTMPVTALIVDLLAPPPAEEGERVEELEVALRDVLAVAVQEQTDPPSDALGAIEDRARQALDTGGTDG